MNMKNFYNAVLLRYDEIAIKGNNRPMFEKDLIENIRIMLKQISDLKIMRIRGRIWIEKKTSVNFPSNEIDLINKELPKVFGLDSFSPGIMCKPETDEIRKNVKDSSEAFFKGLLEKKKCVTFRSRVRRSNKKFPMDSKEVEIDLATLLDETYGEGNVKVDLSDSAEITIGCEIRDEFAFIFYENIRGPGGLPVGCNPPVLALLSGGIDSPVACYMAMKRGCPVSFLTFHSYPYTPMETIDKIKKLVKVINGYQRGGTLYSCNIFPMQKLVRDNCSGRYRTILYRRMMFRIGEKLADKYNYSALVTGEAVGQVASQTIHNMNTINDATSLLVLRPLVCMDKHETIRVAERIGTLNISNEQFPDSCTVFASSSPATSSTIKVIEEEEAKLGDYNAVIDEIMEGIEVFKHS